MGKNKKYRVVDVSGEPCISCGRPTETREHTNLTEKHLRQPYYFTRWFNCFNPACKTTIFMVEKYKVWNRNGAAQALQARREYADQLTFLKSL